MKPFLQIKTPAGHVYEIPTEPIAQNRAAAMLALHPDEFADLDAALADTRELFDDSYQIKEWASNNMNWEDLSDHARMVRYTPPTDEWLNGEFSYHNGRAILGEVDGDTVFKQPLEMLVTTMAASQQLCNATVLNDAQGNPMAAVVVIIGNKSVIGSYLTAIQFVGDTITGAVAAVAGPAH